MIGIAITTTISQSMRSATARSQKAAYSKRGSARSCAGGSARAWAGGGIPSPKRGSTRSGELDQLLSKIFALEERDQAAGRALQPFEHRLAVLESTLAEVAGKRVERLAVAFLPVEHDHALHAQSVDEDRAPVAHAVGVGRVVVRDRAADDDTAEQVRARQHGVEDLAADIVEVHVDALRTGLLKRRGEIAALVVDAGIEAELVLHVRALLASAGDADGAPTPDLRELAHDAADRTGSRRH